MVLFTRRKFYSFSFRVNNFLLKLKKFERREDVVITTSENTDFSSIFLFSSYVSKKNKRNLVQIRTKCMGVLSLPGCVK